MAVSEAVLAFYRGEPDEARRLLRPDGELPASEAALFARLDRLRELLPAAANERSPDGFTPLHLAIFGGSEQAVRLLLDAGADPNALAEAEIARVRPLGTARFVGRDDLYDLLVAAGADTTLPVEETGG